MPDLTKELIAEWRAEYEANMPLLVYMQARLENDLNTYLADASLTELGFVKTRIKRFDSIVEKVRSIQGAQAVRSQTKGKADKQSKPDFVLDKSLIKTITNNQLHLTDIIGGRLVVCDEESMSSILFFLSSSNTYTRPIGQRRIISPANQTSVFSAPFKESLRDTHGFIDGRNSRELTSNEPRAYEALHMAVMMQHTYDLHGQPWPELDQSFPGTIGNNYLMQQNYIRLNELRNGLISYDDSKNLIAALPNIPIELQFHLMPAYIYNVNQRPVYDRLKGASILAAPDVEKVSPAFDGLRLSALSLSNSILVSQTALGYQRNFKQPIRADFSIRVQSRIPANDLGENCRTLIETLENDVIHWAEIGDGQVNVTDFKDRLDKALDALNEHVGIKDVEIGGLCTFNQTDSSALTFWSINKIVLMVLAFGLATAKREDDNGAVANAIIDCVYRRTDHIYTTRTLMGRRVPKLERGSGRAAAIVMYKHIIYMMEGFANNHNYDGLFNEDNENWLAMAIYDPLPYIRLASLMYHTSIFNEAARHRQKALRLYETLRKLPKRQQPTHHARVRNFPYQDAVEANYIDSLALQEVKNKRPAYPSASVINHILPLSKFIDKEATHAVGERGKARIRKVSAISLIFYLAARDQDTRSDIKVQVDGFLRDAAAQYGDKIARENKKKKTDCRLAITDIVLDLMGNVEPLELSKSLQLIERVDAARLLVMRADELPVEKKIWYEFVINEIRNDIVERTGDLLAILDGLDQFVAENDSLDIAQALSEELKRRLRDWLLGQTLPDDFNFEAALDFLQRLFLGG